MRNTFTCVAVFTAMSVTLAVADKGRTGPETQIKSLSWLAGDWEGAIWGGTFHAYYTAPQGGRVMSYNRLIKDGRQTYHEFEVFEIDRDTVVFRPFPRGKPATPMPLAVCDPGARRIVFEKPDKDFPTRIEYHRIADDRLVITLTDPHCESDKVETFDLKRVPVKAP